MRRRNRRLSPDPGNLATRVTVIFRHKLTTAASSPPAFSSVTNMALSEDAAAAAGRIPKDESAPLRTALPNRSVASKSDNSNLRAPSPPPEDGSQCGRSPSPLKPRHFDRSPSITNAQTSHPISPASSAHERVQPDAMSESPSQSCAPVPTQTGQVCR